MANISRVCFLLSACIGMYWGSKVINYTMIIFITGPSGTCASIITPTPHSTRQSSKKADLVELKEFVSNCNSKSCTQYKDTKMCKEDLLVPLLSHED